MKSWLTPSRCIGRRPRQVSDEQLALKLLSVKLMLRVVYLWTSLVMCDMLVSMLALRTLSIIPWIGRFGRWVRVLCRCVMKLAVSSRLVMMPTSRAGDNFVLC